MAEKGSRLSNLLRTTDHKTIGLMYLATSFAFFIAGGLMAMLMRGELARPGCSSCRRSSTTSCSRCTAR